MPATIGIVLSNDAVTDNKRGVYTDIGPNMQRRIDAAVAWYERYAEKRSWIWSFGAGTAEAFCRGPTLATLASQYLQRRHLLETEFCNKDHHNFYGTYEEIKWVMMELKIISKPKDTRVIIFGPGWHVYLRARFIWWLFFKREWGEATFVATSDRARFGWWHELAGCAKVLAIKQGWLRSRDETPYVSLD
jgi:hypothetical protein